MNKAWVPFYIVIILGALTARSARAAEDEIVTDRPGLVESSTTVAVGRWQLEAGSSWERQGGQRRHSTPLLLRAGLAEDWELRLETDGAVSQRGGGERISGWADGALGLKWHWQDGDAASGRPGLAFLLHLDADSGSADFRGKGWRPSLRLTAEWELPADLSLGVIGGLCRDHNAAGQSYTGGIFGASLGWPLARDWRAYVELAGEQLAASRNGGKQASVGGGLTWLLSPRLQLDASLNRGLNRQTADRVWGLGLSLGF